MVILDDRQLSTILQNLEAFFPRSLQMHSAIRNRLCHKYDWPGTEFVADRFPDFSVVILRPVKGSNEYVVFPRANGVLVFSQSADSLQKFLDADKTCFDFTQPTDFIAVSVKDAAHVLLKHCRTLGSLSDWTPDDGWLVFLLHPKQLAKRDIPEGFHLGRLKEEHAEQVNKEWHYGSDATLPFFQYILRHNFPTSGIFTDTDNQLVAYISYQPDGSMGHGYVVPEFRNKGLFQVVNYDCAQQIVEMGQKTAWVNVHKSNDASCNAYLKLGAKCVDRDVFRVDWIDFKPFRE